MDMKQRVEYIPVKVAPQKRRFNLLPTILKAIDEKGLSLEDGDILVISSKFIALSEGRIIKLSKVKPSKEAEELAHTLHLPSSLAEVVLREADVVFSGVPGFILTIKEGALVPNAGIDRSNIHQGYVILYPKEPFQQAERLRKKILLYTGRKVGVVITDSRLLPTRKGTTGITLAASGFEPVKDERGKRDLFGNIMRVTQRALADDISAGAQLLMGETDESIPVIIARNTGIKMKDKPITRKELMVDYDECVYVRGLSRGRRV